MQYNLPLVSVKFQVTAQIDNDIWEIGSKRSFNLFSVLNINQINNQFTEKKNGTPLRKIS